MNAALYDLVVFANVQKAQAELTEFMDALSKECLPLHDLLKNHAEDFHVKVAKAGRFVCFTVEGMSDAALIYHGLPRGLHIVTRVVESDRVTLVSKAGFLPKFDNLGGNLHDMLAILPDGATVHLNPKYSGNLCFVHLFKDEDQNIIRIAVYTKNSAGGDVKHRTVPQDDLVAYFKDKVNIRGLYDSGVRCIAFEAMLLCDGTHGSRVVSTDAEGNKVNAYVCTSLHGDNTSPQSVNDLTPRIPDWKHIALANGLCVDPGYEKTIDKSNRLSVLQALLRFDDKKDFMTVNEMCQILKEGGFVRPFADHPNVIEYGQVMRFLEGVIVCTTHAGKESIFKYKCPDYTRVTFGLRAWWQLRENFRKRYGRKPVPLDLVRHAHRYVNIWCKTPEGKACFYEQVVLLALLMDKAENVQAETNTLVKKFHDAVLLPPLRTRLEMKEKGIPESHWTEPFTESWILAFEYMEDNRDAVTAWMHRYPTVKLHANYRAMFPWETRGAEEEEEEKKPLNGTVPLVVVLGPIGFGKTTTANKLAAELGGVSLDCDKLNFRSPNPKIAESLVRSLGHRRKTETWCCILNAMATDKPVVISAGGGQLFADEISMLHYIAHQLLDKGVDLTLVLADHGAEIKDNARDLSAVRKVYAIGADPEVLKARFGPGGNWSEPGLFDEAGELTQEGAQKMRDITQKGKNNFQFWEKLSRFAGNVTSASALNLNPSSVKKERGENVPVSVPGVETHFKWAYYNGMLLHVTESHRGNGKCYSLRPFDPSDSVGKVKAFKLVCPYSPSSSSSCSEGGGAAAKRGKQKGSELVILWCPSLGSSAHVTISPSRFKPALMGDVAKRANELDGKGGDLTLQDQEGKEYIVRIPPRDRMIETSFDLVGASFAASFVPPSLI